MKDMENKSDEEFLLLTLRRNTPEFALILRHRVIAVPKQWVIAGLALGACVFLDSPHVIVSRK
jgi:hypothetical protein